MATVTKDFRIKSGLVVEGTTGTINGSQILTEASTEFLQDTIGGMVASNTESGISVEYDDASAKLNFNVNDPTITISGDVDGNAVMTNLGDTNISVTLDTVNGNVGSFGGTTKIPTLTVNGKGLVTAAGEVDVATNLSIAGDTGTDTVSLLTDTLTFEGGNGITSTISNNKVKVDIDSTVATLTDQQTLTNKVLGTNVDLGANLDAASYKIINLGEPTSDNDAANKAYVDAAISGLAWKESVHLLGATNVALTGATGTLVIDSHDALVTADVGYRILLTGQTTATENGIYEYTETAGSYTLVRSEDANTLAELVGAAVFVKEGTFYGATSWVQTEYTLSSFSDLTWIQFSGTGNVTEGTGIDINGREISVDLSELSTTTLPEGDNKYYTDERVDDRVASLVQGGTGITASYDDNGNLLTLSAEFTEFDTSDVVEDPAGTGTSGTLYFTNARAVTALEAVVPNFEEVRIDSLAKQVAAQVSAPTAATAVTAYAFAKASFRSAKFLVKVAYGSHTEISEVLLTLDTSDNIAITEYAVVGTNGSSSAISADIDGTDVRLRVTPVNASSTVTVMGTLLV
jgi:hypothetical protein